MKNNQGKNCNNQVRIQIIQVNLQKAKLAQTEISRKIAQFNKSLSDFLIFIQEPMVVNNRATWQPSSCKKYSIQNSPRAMIYTNNNMKAWFLESLSTRDLVVVQTKLYSKNVLLILEN